MTAESSDFKSAMKKLDYPVPSHANTILYMFGGISLVAFVILIISGIYISQFYSPTTTGAYASITHFITDVPLADFMRSIHFWVANLVVGLLMFHVARVFITGSYKKPRRLTWLSGVALLALTVTFIFVGTVLKVDQEGIEALGHMQESLNLFGLHLGLTNAGVPIITQLYTWHTTILLLLLLGLLGLHMLLIKVRGISPKASKEAVATVTAGTGTSHFLTHLRRLCGFGLIFMAIAGTLAILFPAPIGQPGVLGQEVTKPLWMFWPFFGLEDIFGLKGLVYGMVAFFVILALIPSLDRGPYVNWAKRKFIMTFGLLFAVTVIGLGVYARLHPAEAHLGMEMGGSHDSSEMATADDRVISHQELYREGLYLAPTLVTIGAVGAVMAYRKK